MKIHPDEGGKDGLWVSCKYVLVNNYSNIVIVDPHLQGQNRSYSLGQILAAPQYGMKMTEVLTLSTHNK